MLRAGSVGGSQRTRIQKQALKDLIQSLIQNNVKEHSNVVSLELCLAQIPNRGLYGSELATVHDVGIKKAKLENNSTWCFIPGSTIADNVHS